MFRSVRHERQFDDKENLRKHFLWKMGWHLGTDTALDGFRYICAPKFVIQASQWTWLMHKLPQQTFWFRCLNPGHHYHGIQFWLVLVLYTYPSTCVGRNSGPWARCLTKTCVERLRSLNSVHWWNFTAQDSWNYWKLSDIFWFSTTSALSSRISSHQFSASFKKRTLAVSYS